MTRFSPIEVTEGSCIDLQLLYKDENGTVEDLTSDTFAIVDAVPAALGNGVLTKSDPANGVVLFHLDDQYADQLGAGNVNRFRVVRTFADGCESHSEEIWIKVK